MTRMRAATGGVILAAVLWACAHGAMAADAVASPSDGRKTVDLAELCLRLGPVQEPGLDVRAMRDALGALEDQARASLKDVAEPAERVKRLNKLLLADRQVSYMSNKYWRDSTLAASLLRRRGNCLSTTTLYAVLGQRLGLPVRAVVIPQHAFARYDDGTVRVNIETTDGGAQRSDDQYRDFRQWTAADGRLLGYGRNLTDHEFAAVITFYAAIHLQSAQQPAKALELLEEARRLWPGNPSYDLVRLGLLYEDQGRRPEALTGYQQVVLGSESPEIRAGALLGLALDRQANSRHDESLALLQQAYGIAPKHAQPAALSLMSVSYRALRRFDEALLAQELAALLNGQAEDFTNLAIFYKNANKLEDAIRCLRASLKMNPENWNTRLILAGYLIRAGKDKEGWDLFKTVERPPVDELLYETNLAWFYGSIGMKKEFLTHLDAALNLSKTPAILEYVKTEVDFDRWREDAEFKAVVERHRRRMAGGQ